MAVILIQTLKAELGQRFGPAYGKSNPLLGDHSSKQRFEDHVPAERMRGIIGEENWDTLYTFSFVRNPFDRIQSLYHFLKKYDYIPRDWSFSEFAQRLVNADENTPYLGYYGLRFGASDFILDRNGNMLVDDIFRYEERDKGIKQISEKIGFQGLGQIRILEASPKNTKYREMYDDLTRDLVAQRYVADLELFSYNF